MKNLLRKTLTIASLLLLIPSLYGIDLQNKIPKNALYVFTINGQNILSKMPMAELDKLIVMNDLCKELTKSSGSKETKLANLGVNVGGTSYFFVELSDSILYFSYLFPISDAKKFESAFIGKNKPTKDGSGNMTISTNSATIVWNKEYGMIVGGEVMTEYFSSHPETYDRYGFGKKDGDKDAIKEETPNYTDEVAPAVDTVAIDPDNNYSTEKNDYYDDWSSKYDQRKEIGKLWREKKSVEILSLRPADAITTNDKFNKSQDKTAEALMWVGSNQGVLYNFMSKFYQNLYGGNSYSKTKMNTPGLDPNSPLLSDKNYAISTLRFNKNNIKADITAGLDPRLMEDYMKITNAQLNKKFFNYIPGENLLGYYSIAYNSQAILEATPKMMTPYMQMMPYVADISSEMMDLYALFIDEQALGKLVKGDGIFAITDLREKEVPYTTYEYDSLYNYKEIVSTKKETVPEFVVMFSTEDAVTMDKIFSIAFKKGGLVKIADNHYETVKMRGMPFTISILQKDGIVFICNSKEQVEIIQKGKVKTPVSAENMKNMNSNSVNMFVDIKKIFSLIPEEKKTKSKEDKDYESSSTKMLNYCRKNVGQVNITQAKPTGNEIKSELVLTVPNGSENSVKYFFNFINDLYKISERK
jgi:hypothetical protein